MSPGRLLPYLVFHRENPTIKYFKEVGNSRSSTPTLHSPSSAGTSGHTPISPLLFPLSKAGKKQAASKQLCSKQTFPEQ